jgi:TPR repeat protein
MVTAQFNLGVMYEHGLGIPRDYVQAHMWLNLAGAREADPERRSRMVKRRDELAAGMTREQIARAQRLAWEWKPKGR